MDKKPGRNDSCHCGSGKKYKKCCYDKDAEAQRQLLENPPSLNTGTMMDYYMDLFHPMGLLVNKIIQFEKDGKELQAGLTDFEETFKPGDPDGVPDSYFNTWMMLDYRFGNSKKTICERLIESAKTQLKEEITDKFENGLDSISKSYFTFYQVFADSKDYLFVTELYSGNKWRVIKIDDSFDEPFKPGEVLFTRLFGTPHEAFMAAAALTFKKESAQRFKDTITDITTRFARETKTDIKDAFIEASKHFFRHMLHLLLKGISERKTNIPQIVNAEGEDIVLETLIYDIRDAETLKKRIVNMKQVEYDKQNNLWTWYKKGKGIMGMRSILGNMRIVGRELHAEVQSQNRAITLMGKIERELKSSVRFIKSIQKPIQEAILEQGNMPSAPSGIEQLSPTDQAEIKAHMDKYLETYYLTDWIKHPIPALDGLRPLDAVKTAKGKKKLINLIDYMADTEKNKPGDKFDFDILRKKLKLI
jgi:hypothetical protein